MINRYKRYCSTCHYTMYPGEEATKTSKGVSHLNCQEALSDRGIVRMLNPRIQNMIGKVNKKKLVRMLEALPQDLLVGG